VASITEQGPDPRDVARFVEAISGERRSRSDAASSEGNVREYNPNWPSEPRDSWGRWTTGGPGGPASAIAYRDPEYDDDDSDADDDSGEDGGGYDEPQPDGGDGADPFAMDEPDASDGDSGDAPAGREPGASTIVGLDDFQTKVLKPLRARLNKPEAGANGESVVPLKLAVAPSGLALGGAHVDHAALQSFGSLLRMLRSVTGQTRRRKNEPAPKGPAKRLLLLELHGHIEGTGNLMRFAVASQTDSDGRGGRVPGADNGLAKDDLGQIGDIEKLPRDTTMTAPDMVGTLLGEAKVLTPRNAYWIGRALSPYMQPGGLIILNSCVAGLAKDRDKSIAAELARGSGCRVAAPMGFTAGDIVSGSAKIHAAVEKSGMTFAEIIGWNYLRSAMKTRGIEVPPRFLGPGPKPDLDGLLGWLKAQGTRASQEILDGYNKLLSGYYPSADGQIRIFAP
jgi:hypothetical protein